MKVEKVRVKESIPVRNGMVAKSGKVEKLPVETDRRLDNPAMRYIGTLQKKRFFLLLRLNEINEQLATIEKAAHSMDDREGR